MEFYSELESMLDSLAKIGNSSSGTALFGLKKMDKMLVAVIDSWHLATALWSATVLSYHTKTVWTVLVNPPTLVPLPLVIRTQGSLVQKQVS